MKKSVLAILCIALAAALWYGMRRGATPSSKPQDDAAARQYVFEAQHVQLRQMDASGQLQFEVHAEHIAQLPEGGGMLATSLTLYYDPPGTDPGGPNRWTLRAREGRLPNEGRTVTLKGNVLAEGVPEGGRHIWQVATEELQFDMDKQIAVAEGDVAFTGGKYSGRGRGLNVNIETGVATLKSGNDKITL